MKKLEEIKKADIQGDSMDTLKSMADSQVRQYKKIVEKIKNDDNPMMTKEVKDYETAQQRRILDDNIKVIREAYQEIGNQHIAELEREAALTTIKPTLKDKELAEEIAEEAKFNLAMAVGDTSAQEAISKLRNQVEYMTDSQKVALKRKMPELLSYADSDKTKQGLRSIGYGLSVKTEAEGALELMKQAVASGIGQEYRNMTLAEQAGKELRGLFSTEGSSELSTTKTDVFYRDM
ncbi:hypothetical protein [Lentibacillus daqui]|uniref:hypothetical protein n=1 Tax=Lentibacillus daqui TaxID=2911514 RepID=UPI0022B19E07|nr:hypothetical protein [Lentibacillus daqui]